jgi:hypothetical protein
MLGKGTVVGLALGLGVAARVALALGRSATPPPVALGEPVTVAVALFRNGS